MTTLRAEILDRINAKLSNEKTQKKFIDCFLDTALKNPNSYAARRMVDILVPESTVEQIDNLNASRLNEDVSLQKFRIHNALYDKQKQVIDCIGQNRSILCLTSRRCGKSVLDGAVCVWSSLTPNNTTLYLNITSKQAMNQILPEIERFSGVSGLKIIKEDKNEGLIKFENGSQVWIGSNNNKAAADKWRGFKFQTIILDEIGHMGNLDYLLDEVLLPAQTDYANPTLIMTGTPSRVPHHFSTKMFEDEENNVKKFNWSMVENPFLPNPKQAIKEACERKGIDESDPFIQREYYGKFVPDTEAVVVSKRTYKTRLLDFDGVVIGVDYGYRDSDAVVAVGYNHALKKAQVITEFKGNKQTVTQRMDNIERIYKECLKYSDNVQIYCDTNEQATTADLRVNRKLPAFNCYKYDKRYAIELLADCCRNGTLELDKDGYLDLEMEMTLYKRDPDTDEIIHEIDDEVYHPDAFFALLYAMRRVFKELNYEEVKYKESEEERQWKQDANGSPIFSDSYADSYADTTESAIEII